MCQRVCGFRKGRKKYVKKGSFKKIREQLRIKTCAELWGMEGRHSRFRSLPGRLRADSYFLWCIPFSAFNEEIGTLRSDNGNANENVGETLKLFRPYTKSPSYLKVRKLGGNWREGTVSEFRESKMYRLAVPFLQSTQNLSFHVVFVARTAEKCTKRRAELSFFVCSLCRRRRSFVRSLMNGQRGPCPFHWTRVTWTPENRLEEFYEFSSVISVRELSRINFQM